MKKLVDHLNESILDVDDDIDGFEILDNLLSQLNKNNRGTYDAVMSTIIDLIETNNYKCQEDMIKIYNLILMKYRNPADIATQIRKRWGNMFITYSEYYNRFQIVDWRKKYAIKVLIENNTRTRSFQCDKCVDSFALLAFSEADKIYYNCHELCTTIVDAAEKYIKKTKYFE